MVLVKGIRCVSLRSRENSWMHVESTGFLEYILGVKGGEQKALFKRAAAQCALGGVRGERERCVVSRIWIAESRDVGQ